MSTGPGLGSHLMIGPVQKGENVDCFMSFVEIPVWVNYTKTEGVQGVDLGDVQELAELVLKENMDRFQL